MVEEAGLDCEHGEDSHLQMTLTLSFSSQERTPIPFLRLDVCLV